MPTRSRSNWRRPWSTTTSCRPGPDADPTQASQQVAEQKAETQDTELPKDRPNEAEEPDRIVTQSNSDKPREDEPKVAAVETQAAIEQPAAAGDLAKDARGQRARGGQGQGADHRHRQGQAETDRNLGPEGQRLFQAAQALPGRQEQAKIRHGEGEDRAQPARACDVRRCRAIVGRCRLRRGRDFNDPPLRSGAAPPPAALPRGSIQLLPGRGFHANRSKGEGRLELHRQK